MEIYFLEWQDDDGTWKQQVQLTLPNEGKEALSKLALETKVERTNWRVATYTLSAQQSLKLTLDKREPRV